MFVKGGGKVDHMGAIDPPGVVGKNGLQGAGHAPVGVPQGRRSGGLMGNDLRVAGGGHGRVSGGGIAGRFRRVKDAR